MRGSTSVGYDQFETSPEAIEQELRPAVCERRPTDRLKANYSIDKGSTKDIILWRFSYKIRSEQSYLELEARAGK